MALTSAQQEARRAEKRAARNRSSLRSLKTYITKARKAIGSGDLEPGQESVAAAVRALDKAAQKGLIHANSAARRKSRLMKMFHQAQAKAGASS